MVPEVEDSVAVGLRVHGDVEVVLFVKLAPSRGVRHSEPPRVRIRVRLSLKSLLCFAAPQNISTYIRHGSNKRLHTVSL